MLFLYGGPFFYFQCWVSSPISLHLKKQTLVWTVHWFLHTCILHLLYYSMSTISMRYTCYKLKATAETSSSFVFLQYLYFELLLYELTLMQELLMPVFKYYSWKVFALWFSCLLMSFTIVLIAAFITCAYNSMIKIMLVALSLRNYLCYRLPTRDE